MRTFLVVLLSALLSVAVMQLFVHKSGSTGGSAMSEDTYNRVMTSHTLRCGYATWPPFVVKDPNSGKMSGVLVDMVEEIGKSLNLKIDWAYETGYGNYAEDLNTGRFDVMCATLWVDAGRINSALLIDPFLYTGVYTVVRADDTRFDNSLDGLNDPSAKITAIDGDITLTLANTLFPKAQKVSLQTIATPAELAENVKAKKADAFFSDLGFFNSYNAENPGKLKILLNNPAWVFGERMAVKNGEWRLKYALDTAISELINAGKTAEIIGRYKGTSTVSPAKMYSPLPKN